MRKAAFLLAATLLFAACGKEADGKDGSDEGGGTTASLFSEVFPYTKDGQTLYYRIIGDHAEVTHPVPSWEGYLQPDSNITIPKTVIYKGKSYVVTSIGDSAFYDCNMQAGYNYINVTIPPTVSNLGDYSLWFSEDVCKIKCLPLTPPVIGRNPFIYGTPGHCEIINGEQISTDGKLAEVYVTCESLELYKSASGWSDIDKIIKCIED